MSTSTQQNLIDLISSLGKESADSLLSIPEIYWVKLMTLIGEKVVNISECLSNKYKDIEYLRQLKPHCYINDRDKVLLAFLEGLSGLSFDNEH